MNKKWGYFLTGIFFIIVSYLLYEQLSDIKIEDISSGFSQMSLSIIGIGILLTIFNYLVLTSFDYVALKRLKTPSVTYPMALINAFVCYAFNLNLGSRVGGVGFRYRLYTKLGVEKEKIPFIVISSTLANWSGYGLLISLILFIKTETANKITQLPSLALLAIGITLASVLILFFYACLKQKEISVKGISFQFPKIKIALIQMFLSTLQWLSISYIIFHFLNGLGVNAEFPLVLMTYLLASIAAVATHLPAGLGVIETIFLRMDSSIPNSKIIVALICFRAIYNLIPLMMAIPIYFTLEFKKNKKRTKTSSNNKHLGALEN